VNQAKVEPQFQDIKLRLLGILTSKAILATTNPLPIHYPPKVLQKRPETRHKQRQHNRHLTVGWDLFESKGHGGCLKSWDIQPFWFGWRTAGMGKAGLFCGKIEKTRLCFGNFLNRNSNQNCSKQGANF
jgi:hypothetical protein